MSRIFVHNPVLGFCLLLKEPILVTLAIFHFLKHPGTTSLAADRC